MTQNKITVLALTVFFVALKGYSQDLKLAGIQYNNYQKSELKNASEGQETEFQEFGVLVNIPQKLKNEKTTLIHGLGYGFVIATTYNSLLFNPNTNEKELQEFYYRLTVNHQWNEK